MLRNVYNFIKAEVNLWVFHPRLWTKKLLQPKMTIDSLEGLDIQKLKQEGIKAIAIDWDGVMVGYHSFTQPQENKIKKIEELSCHFIVGILSNRKGRLLSALEDTLREFKLPILRCEKMKPHPDAYNNAAICLNTPIFQTAIIEDRLVTGIAGANRLGMFTIWVTPPVMEKKEPLNVRIYRSIEENILKIF